MVEFEHTIFILLLLIGILNAKPPKPRWATIMILIGIMMAFIPPARKFPIPWDIALGLVVPLLLWQNIRRIVNAQWRGWKSVALWASAVLIFGAALGTTKFLSWPGALLFGLITASMVWRAGESEDKASYMSQIGPLALIFLLTEVEAAIQAPDHYLGGVFSGAFFGAVAGASGFYLLRKTSPRLHSWIGVGQVYLAYWFSYVTGVSAVTAALVGVMMFMWLNQYYSLGFHKKEPPAPMNTWLGFGLILALFMLLGWQAHQPLSYILAIEVVAGALLGLGIAWLGYKWKIPAFHKQRSFWVAGLRTALLLFPALLLWPRGILQQPFQLAVAIGITVLVIGISYIGLSYSFPKKSNS